MQYEWGEYYKDGDKYEQSADTEAQARAKMLIFLINNELIDPTALQ